MSAKPGQTVEQITVPLGDPDTLEAAGKQLGAVSLHLEDYAGQLGLSPTLLTHWAGTGSSAFAELTGQQAYSVRSASLAVMTTGFGIQSNADLLRDAQERAQKAIERAKRARHEITTAREAIKQAKIEIQDAKDRMSAATIARQTAEMQLFTSAVDALTGGNGAAQAAIDAANDAYRIAESDLLEAERRLKRAEHRLTEAIEDMKEARKDGADAAEDGENAGILMQGLLRMAPPGIFSGAIPGVPAEGTLAAAGNVPREKPGNVPISEMEPPEDWPWWAKSLYKVGRGEATVIAGTVGMAKKAYDDPEKIPGALGDVASRGYHDPIGTGKAIVGYDELANGRWEDWVGQMGIGALSGGSATLPARASRLNRVVGSPKYAPLGRSPYPINSRKYAGSRMDFGRPDLGAPAGAKPPKISEADRLKLAEKYPDGVRYTRAGYPIFTDHAIERVHVDGLTGDRTHDADLANAKAKRTETPQNYVWHHVEDGRTMELVPRDLHDAARHTGGAAAIENGRVGQVRPGGVFTPFEGATAGGGAAGGFVVGGPAAASGGG
jgi:HNH/ENDO VII superfamily nuclease/type VII secretion system ESX-1 substrate